MPNRNLLLNLMNAPDKGAQVKTTYDNFSQKLPWSSIDTSGRYPTFFAGLDNEEIYGQTQSRWSKYGAGFVKGVNIAGTTFLQSTVGLVNGIYQWADTGDFTSFYDNDLTRSLNEHNKGLENSWANYYTNDELNAPWYSPRTWFTANFWADTIIKNTGFAAGAALSAGAWGAALRTVGVVARSLASGAGKEVVGLAQRASNLESAGLLGKTTQQIGKLTGDLNSVAKRYVTLNKMKDFGWNATRSGLASFGEASIEGIHSKEDYENKLIAEYQDKFGYEPQGEELQKIKDESAKVGDFTVGANVGLLTATNYIMLPKILGRFWKSGRESIAASERGLSRVALKDAEGNILKSGSIESLKSGKWAATDRVAEFLGGKKFGPTASRWIGNSRAGLATIFSGAEAFEEGMQTIIPFSAEDYFDKGRLGQDNNFMESFKEGVKNLFNTKDGMISILAGGISGGLMKNTGIIGGRPFNDIRTLRERRNRTSEFVNSLNESMLGSGYLVEANESIVRGEKLEAEATSALENNNRLQYEDTKSDQILNYLLPRIQYGRYDLVQDELRGIREVATTEEGYAELQANGYAEDTMSREDFIAGISKIEEQAKSTKNQFEALNIRYGGETIKDPATGATIKKYSPSSLMQLAYVGAKLDDYNKRIPGLLQDFNSAGLDITTLMEKVHNSALTVQGTQDHMRNYRSSVTPASINEYKRNNEELTKSTEDSIRKANPSVTKEDLDIAVNTAIVEEMVKEEADRYRESRREQTIAEEDLNSFDDQIDSLSTLNIDQKEALKEKAADLLEITARRDFKIKEYEEIVKNPQLYSTLQPRVGLAEQGRPDLTSVDFSKVEDEVYEGDFDQVADIINKEIDGGTLTLSELDFIEEYKKLYEALWDTVEETQDQALRRQAKREGWFFDSNGNPIPPTAKSTFFKNNQGEYLFNFNGTTREGELSFEPETDTIYFDYVDENGDINRAEVFRDDFINGNIVRKDGEEIAEGEFLSDENFNDPNSTQNKVNKLITESKARQEEINREVEQIKKDIEETDKKIKESRVSKNFTKDFVESVSKLTQHKNRLEENLDRLLEERKQIDFQIEELDRLLSGVPRTLKSSIELLHQERDNLSSLSAQSFKLSEALSNLLSSAKDLVQRLGKKLISRISGMNIPPTPSFETIKKAIKRWEETQSEQDLDEVIRIVNDEYVNITNFYVRPLTEGETNIISSEVLKLTNFLENVESISRAKEAVIERLEELSDTIVERETIVIKTPARKSSASDNIQAQPVIDMQQEVEEITEEKEDFVDKRSKELEEDGYETEEATKEAEKEWNRTVPGKRLKKLKDNVTETYDPNSDKTPIETYYKATSLLPPKLRNKTWDIRLSNFIDRIGTFDKNRRKNLRLLAVTAQNEESLGLKGFTAKFFTQDDGSPFVSDTVEEAPIGLVLVESTPSGVSYLNERGEIIQPDLDTILVTKMKSSLGIWRDGQTGYSNPRNITEESIRNFKQEHQDRRKSILSGSSAQTFPFTISYGRVTPESESIPVMGNMVQEQEIENSLSPIIGVSGKGEISINTSDGQQRVYTRKLSKEEKNIIKQALNFLIKERNEGRDQEDNYKKVASFLEGATYTKIGNNSEVVEIMGRYKFNLSNRKITSPTGEELSLDGIVDKLTTNVSKFLINNNDIFREVTSFLNGIPQFREWPSYQHFLLSPDGREPSVQGRKRADRYLILQEESKASSATRPTSTPIEEIVTAPIIEQQANTQEVINSEIDTLSQEKQSTLDIITNNPDLTNREKELAIERQTQEYDKRIQELSATVVAPPQIVTTPPKTPKQTAQAQIKTEAAKSSKVIKNKTDLEIAQEELIDNIRDNFTRYNSENISQEERQVEEEKAKAVSAIVFRMATTMAERNPDTYPNGVIDVYNSVNFTQTFSDLQKQSGTILNQIIGEETASNMIESEMYLNRLRQAKSMRDSGVSPRLIKVMTGWEYDPGQMDWKMETADTFDFNFTVPKRATSKNLISFLSNTDNLLDQLPELSEYKIEFSRAGRQYLGQVNTDTKTISLNLDLLKNKSDQRATIKSVLIHEFQHLIQDNEGWQSGGIGSEANYTYLSGEVEARNAQSRSLMSVQDRVDSLLSDTEDVRSEDKIFLVEALGEIKSALDESVGQMDESVLEASSTEETKGAINLLQGGQAIIYAATGTADITTILHEFAHFFEANSLTEKEQNLLKQEANKEYGREATEVEVSEFFARGFEGFLAEENTIKDLRDKRTSPSLKSIFSQVRKFILDIYDSIFNSGINITLSDNMRQMYSDMLGIEFYKKEAKAKGFKGTVVSPELRGESIEVKTNYKNLSKGNYQIVSSNNGIKNKKDSFQRKNKTHSYELQPAQTALLNTLDNTITVVDNSVVMGNIAAQPQEVVQEVKNKVEVKPKPVVQQNQEFRENEQIKIVNKKPTKVKPPPATVDNYKTQADAQDVNGGVFMKDGDITYIVPYFDQGYIEVDKSTYSSWEKAPDKKKGSVLNKYRSLTERLQPNDSVTLTQNIDGVDREATYTVGERGRLFVAVTSSVTGETLDIPDLVFAEGVIEKQVSQAFTDKYLGQPFRDINSYLNPSSLDLNPEALPSIDLNC